MLTLIESDADKTVDLPAGETVEIRLAENATTGYRWTIETLDNKVCELIADERHGPETAIPGAPGTHVWRLKGSRAGECRIAIAYRRTWQGDAPPARLFKLTLRVSA